MNSLALTPEAFSTAALAWLGALGIVLTAIAAFVIKFAPQIAEVRAALAQILSRQNSQSARMNALTSDVAKVATAVPSPTAGPMTAQPTPVQVVNTPADPVQTHESDPNNHN